jgi:hypothetical protein
MAIDWSGRYMVIGKDKIYKPSEIERLVEYGIAEYSHTEGRIHWYKYCTD